MRNNALESAYPTGSSFKPFTLLAALETGVATPATRMTCRPTWDFGGVQFVNFEPHQLPGLRVARGGDGLQLQHDLHAAVDGRL